MFFCAFESSIAVLILKGRGQGGERKEIEKKQAREGKKERKREREWKREGHKRLSAIEREKGGLRGKK